MSAVIKTITIDGKTMTKRLFNQLPRVQWYVETTAKDRKLEPSIEPLGIVIGDYEDGGYRTVHLIATQRDMLVRSAVLVLDGNTAWAGPVAHFGHREGDMKRFAKLPQIFI